MASLLVSSYDVLLRATTRKVIEVRKGDMVEVTDDETVETRVAKVVQVGPSFNFLSVRTINSRDKPFFRRGEAVASQPVPLLLWRRKTLPVSSQYIARKRAAEAASPFMPCAFFETRTGADVLGVFKRGISPLETC